MNIDYPKHVFAGILPDRKDNLLYAQQHLDEEHFLSTVYKGLWKALDRYYEVTGGVLPQTVLTDLLSKSADMDAAKVLLYEETFEQCSALEISDHEFRYAVDSLKDQRAFQLTGEALTQAYEVLVRGAEVNRENLKGHRDARTYATSQFSVIDKLDNIQAAPEGDMMHEGSEVLAEYIDRKTGKIGQGVLTGISAIDKVTSGFGAGELIVVAAFTNAGKTQFCCQTAWHTAVKQGKNVFFATSETVRPTVRRRIIARHSMEPQFGLDRGLNSTDIKNGTLSPEEEKVLKAVVDDLDNNPAYGKLHITQVPRGATLSYLEARMNRQGALWQIDLALVDYLALLKSDRKRNSEREEFNDVIRDAKVYATSFNEGNGVPLVSPWQIRRESHAEALTSGMYTLSSLSDTAEIEKSADQIVSLLKVGAPETKELSLQFLKMRDGEIPNAVTLTTDFRCSYLDVKGAQGAVNHVSGVTGPLSPVATVSPIHAVKSTHTATGL